MKLLCRFILKSKPKVNFYTNIIPPYRQALFNSLSQEVDLQVHSASHSEAHRGWSDFSTQRDFELLEHKLPRLLIRETFFYFPKPSWLKNRNCDAVVVGGWEQPANLILILLSILRKQRFYIFYESTENDATYSRSSLVYFMKKMIFRIVDGVITTGESSSENVKSLGVARNKIYQGFNAIDSEWWSSKNKSRKHKSSELGTRYIYVGQLIRRKRIDMLIESYSHISRDIDSLLIVGDGPLEQELKSLNENLNSLGKIEFRNSINSETLRSVYLEQDVLILPSDFEVWGMVALEALACELSLILSVNCGVTPELKNFSNVLVFKTKDELEISLVEARTLKLDPELNNFFQDKSIKHFSKLIASLCTPNREICDEY